MNLDQLTFNDWMTLIVIIAQAGIVYYRLKRVERKAEKINKLIVEFAIQKNTFEHHQSDFDKEQKRMEKNLNKLDDRISGIELHAVDLLFKNSGSGFKK